MDNQQTQQLMHAFMGAYFAFIFIAFLVKVALYTIPMWRICKRAGIAPGLAFICAIPFIGRLIAIYIIAFSSWKVAPALAQYTGLGSYPPSSYPPANPPSYPPSGYPPQGPTA